MAQNGLQPERSEDPQDLRPWRGSTVEPSDLVFQCSLVIRHYSDGITYAALTGHERSEPWAQIVGSYDNGIAGLDQAIDDVARMLVAWAEAGPLGVAGVIATLRS
jgi:hypothetical protein